MVIVYKKCAKIQNETFWAYIYMNFGTVKVCKFDFWDILGARAYLNFDNFFAFFDYFKHFLTILTFFYLVTLVSVHIFFKQSVRVLYARVCC